ncbi:hypothetical protein QYM36_015699, partial [Artemia franciscana]
RIVHDCTKYPDPGPVEGPGSYIIEDIAPNFEQEEALRRDKEAARPEKEEAARLIKSPVFKKEDHPRHQTQPAYFGPTFWGGFGIGLGLITIGVVFSTCC